MAEVKRREALARALETRIRAEVAAAAAELERRAAIVRSLEGGVVEQAVRTHEIARAAYREDAVELLYVLDALETRQEVELLHSQALYDYQITHERLLAATAQSAAGGFLMRESHAWPLAACFVLSLSTACQEAGEATRPDQPAPAAEPSVAESGVVRLSAEAERNAGVSLGKAEARELPDLITAPGELALNADRTVRAAAFVEGVITECCRSVGELVREGEVLAEMHSHQTHELLAEYRQARAALEARRSELQYAEQERARASRLHELEAGSLQRVQEAITVLDRARTAVESAEAELEGAIAHFEYLGIDTTELRQGQIPDHLVVRVKSPISGVIVERTAAQGGVVTPSDPLYEISDLSSLWLIARVPEQDLALVRSGMSVDVAVKAYPDRIFRGRVERVADVLDPATKTVQVRCLVPNPGRALKQGMFAEATLRSRGMRSALLVPQQAVQRVDDRSVVFIPVGDGGYEARRVDAGGAIDGMHEIFSGLTAGDEIVVGGAFALKSELLKSRYAEE